MSQMTPREIVHALDQHIIGQNKRPEVDQFACLTGKVVVDGMDFTLL